MNKISLAVSIAALLMYGCSDKPKDQEEKNTETQKAQTSQQSTAAPQAIYGATAQESVAKAPTDADMQLNTPHVAKVLETMNAGGYTYAKVDEKGNVYWIAGPQANIAADTTISFIEQMVMTDFTSKSLNRTFEQLVFVSAIIGPNNSAQTAAAATMQTLDDAHKNCDHSKEPNMQASTPEVIKVAKNASGYSVEELYTKKDSLKGKSVKVDAQVVKVSKNIMGKDWVHLQDGSGSAGTNDIIATSANSTVKVGDKVTTTGIVKTDVNLGYGYQYAVIIEEAKFTALK